MKKRNLLFVVGAVIIFLITGIPQNTIKKFQLIYFYSRLTKLEQNQDFSVIYDLLSPEYKLNTTRNDFVAENNKFEMPVSIETTVHSYTVKGNEGLVDRTRISCYSTECSGSDRYEGRTKKNYIYINFRWHIPQGQNQNAFLCDRDMPYQMEPEFERALSLIIQRQSQNPLTKEVAAGTKAIKNCLSINYSDDENMGGAEGLFYFDSSSINDKLKILVSERYQTKDDLLTALLLVHEIVHAYNHATGDDQLHSCYENEAQAFAHQYSFLYHLMNQEERNSFISRYSTVNTRTPEIESTSNMLIYINNYILKHKSLDAFDGALDYVKNNPFYQKQCEKDRGNI